MVNDELHVVHARAAGLDVHKMEITATVRLCLADGPPVSETRRFEALPAGLVRMVGWLRGHRIEAAAMEGTGVYWEAPYDALADAGMEVQLLHAQHVKQLRGRKTDIGDSRWLARVCQFGLGRPSFVPSREFRELRLLSRHRRTLVAERSRARNRVAKVVDRCGARIGGVITDIFGMNGRRILDGLVDRLGRDAILGSLSGHVRDKLDRLGDALTATLGDADRVVLADLLRQHDAVDRRIAALDRHLAEGLAPHAGPMRLLQTIPGIDAASAAAILAETGPDPVAVFGTADRLAAWAGVCPGNNESAGKRRGAHARGGAKHLRAVLVGCAHGAARTRGCQFHAYHRALTVRRGYKRAIVATAHKLARVIFAVLRDGRPYRDPEVDYEALLVQRNAPRWIARLREFGILEQHADGTVTVNWAVA